MPILKAFHSILRMML